MKWMKDTDGKPSVTLTLTFVTFIVALLKAILSGIKIGDVDFGSFPASEFAIMIAPMVTLYWGRRKAQINIGEKGEKDA